MTSRKWRRGDQWYIKYGSDFTVSKALVDGTPIYQAWYRWARKTTLLGTFKDSIEARQCVMAAAGELN
jgi:hypothetical protein